MNKFIITIILLISFAQSKAQYAYFGTRGKISFDKITFTKARMKSMSQQMDPAMMMRFGGGGGGFNIDNMPESTTQKLIFHFDENTTVLEVDATAIAESNTQNRGNQNRGTGQGGGGNRGGMNFGGGAGRGAGRGVAMGSVTMNGNSISAGANANIPRGRVNNNSKIFYQDLKKQTSSVQLEIDEKYIITDSLNNITWRFTDEYREIAGFECRRVNGATADSLYLVAFYTDQIPVSAGPALSSGLPGMILGLAIPEMHIQYWATKVEYTNEPTPTNWKDKKATTISFTEFVKSFGRMFQRGRDSNTSTRQIQEQLIY